MTIAAAPFSSPVGQLLLISDGEALAGLHFEGRHGLAPTPGGEQDAILAEAARQLRAYFAGERHEFALPLRPAGTPFEIEVWEELRRIPYGETLSYGELAARVGSPGAARAVGRANACNPIPIIVPCHRVIGADGSLTGFGGGLDAKRRLLDHEHGALTFSL